ncbi:MAG: CHAT domain-containing protein [Coleofasciculaceae cyanobacterium SM2_1_6]|nr:CHAT domain-containing protein [Coleofasciculaceae cyanobacterium SM2_1_6]
MNRLVKVSLGLSLSFNLSFYSYTAIAQITPNGTGTLVNSQGNQINITGGTQAGGNLFHSFQDFNVNSNQVANFLSNPQTQNILGRINGGNPSVINGLLQVTGGNSHLFLMNPAGIIFGQGASLNVPASFMATTANQIGFGNNVFNALGDNNFSALTGNPDRFLFTTNQAGSIVNAGNLAVTSGQSISLLGGNVVNTGNLHGGNITLAAVPGTNRVRISQPGHLLSLEIIPSAASSIAPLDLPRLLTGQSLPGITSNGEIVQVAGVNIPTGQGVNVTSGNLSLASSPLPMGEGVRAINILGDRVTLLNADLNATGVNGGGTIRVGGEYRGGGTNPFNSRFTYVDAGSFLRADAVNSGDGGRVIVWGDDTTRFYGNITARGGANAGNGGFAEVSGAQTLTFAGNADLSAPRGSFGTLLLDPVNILISNGADALGGCALPSITLGCDPGDITISQATLEALGAATNIVLEASNNITFGTLTGSSLNFATCTVDPCGDISFTAGGVFNTNGNNLVALGRNLSITAASIATGAIDTSISAPLRDGGAVSLNGTTGNISTGNIDTASSFLTGAIAGNGGNIVIEALNGIVITGDLNSRSVIDGTGTAANAGDVTVIATNITTGIIAAYSRVDGGTAGNGGNISVTATNGSVTATGMTTSTGAAITGTGGNGGNITIDATENITITGAIIPPISPTNVFALDSRSLSTAGGNTGVGGNIQINQNLISNGNFNATGEINSSSAALDSGIPRVAERGGEIEITAQNIIVDSLISLSTVIAGTSGDGGDINLTATSNITTRGLLESSSFSEDGGDIELTAGGNINALATLFSGSTLGDSGDIELTAGGNISTQVIDTTTVEGNVGEISLITGGNLSTSDLRSRSDLGDGGDVFLNAAIGNISIGSIYAESVSGSSGTGGTVEINAGNLFLATGSFTARDGTLASISTQGGSGGGEITITHGGDTIVPFVVGGATVNGTAAAITSGTGANTVNSLTVPVPPEINNYGTNIRIRTTALIPLPVNLLPILTNPAPPATPAPAVVGTSPVVADRINFITAPVGSSIAPMLLSATPAITPLSENIIPPVTLPSPSPVPNITNDLPQLSPSNLDPTTPGVQISLATNTNETRLPIITRIPVSALSEDIRLIDESFREEFQAFIGLNNEIATLDVNQAQDILQRIIRETSTKPVFIYVFFAPENDTGRNAESARGNIFRTPKDTDILEVVLVPPNGDLVRVRHPGLRYPQVMEIARRFESLTASRSNGYISSARQFHEWLIAPLQDELKKREIDNLVFLMDVGLRSMPIAALRDQNNGDRFIVEDYSVGLMPSLTLTDTSYTSLKGSEVLGMGSANFVEKSPLPAVPLELNAINQIWGGNTIINENFTLTNLRQARRPGQRIVHLATHGSFNPGDKSNSYIQLWGNERLTLDQIRQAGWSNPPLDLLVLSACQTALGDRDAELGFAGLAVQAGVKSALASLWLVSDEGTFGLMTEFYQRLQETTTKSEALRQTQLAMLRGEVRLEGGNLVTPQGMFPLNEELRELGDRSLRHPYFWSGFTMVGNPW